MPGKYRITASISLSTEIEPDGHLGGIENEVLDYEDNSSWNREGVTSDGGEVSFVVEADSEDDARDKGSDALNNAYYEGDGYFEWEIEDYSITEVEEIEPPMDMERATAMLLAFLSRMREMGGITREEEGAFAFLLDQITP